MNYLKRKQRRLVQEYSRQKKVSEGWLALREIAQAMKKSSHAFQADPEGFLQNYENRLKGLLSERSTRNHKVMGLYRSTASYMRRTKNLEYGMVQFLTLGPSRFRQCQN